MVEEIEEIEVEDWNEEDDCDWEIWGSCEDDDDDWDWEDGDDWDEEEEERCEIVQSRQGHYEEVCYYGDDEKVIKSCDWLESEDEWDCSRYECYRDGNKWKCYRDYLYEEM